MVKETIVLKIFMISGYLYIYIYIYDDDDDDDVI